MHIPTVQSVLEVMTKLPMGRPVRGELEIVKDMDNLEHWAICWEFWDRYMVARRRAHFDASNGEYLGDL
jgi:hypothetical protein